jgi:hypothetical protein
MKKIEFQVRNEKVLLYMSEETYKTMEYMEFIKQLKKDIRHAIKNKKENLYSKEFRREYICIYSFVSSVLYNPDFILYKLTDNQFVVENVKVGNE